MLRFSMLAAATSAFLAMSLQPASAPAQFGPRPPEFASVEVSAERKNTFRIHAPKAEAVRLASSDLPGSGPPGAAGVELKKGGNGVWEGAVGRVPMSCSVVPVIRWRRH